jgi:hypothetical protein
MKEEVMLNRAEPRKILETVINEQVPAIMSYLSRHKWHVAKVVLKHLGANRLEVQVSQRENPHPLNICVDQPVGMSIKYGYGKLVFETKVTALEAVPESSSGGSIVLMVPSRIETVQRRAYFRVKVPDSLKVNTVVWHRSNNNSNHQPPNRYWQAKVIDISAGGAQIAIDAEQQPDFKKGQFIGLRFTPLPYETPLVLNAQIRNILPTADNNSVCLGLQIVGLEASAEGQAVLKRLCSVVEKYYQLQQGNVSRKTIQPAIS